MPYDPYEPRNADGEWTNAENRMTIGREARIAHAGLMDRLAKPDGGFTYSPLTGEQPTIGFVVSPYPERSFVSKHITLENIVKYRIKNRDLLNKPGNFLGAWHDSKTGNKFLDISVVSKNERLVRDMALRYDQKAYFNLATHRSVVVNSKATSGGIA